MARAAKILDPISADAADADRGCPFAEDVFAVARRGQPRTHDIIGVMLAPSDIFCAGKLRKFSDTLKALENLPLAWKERVVVEVSVGRHVRGMEPRSPREVGVPRQ